MSSAWMHALRGGVLAVSTIVPGLALAQAATQASKPAAVEQSWTGQATAGPVISEKQKKLIEDTDRLVKMAAELKVSVDKSNKNELSLDVVRKAEAVEKLAKSVKERIREAR